MEITLELVVLGSTLALVLVAPYLGQRELRALERDLAAGQTDARARFFVKSAWSEWIPTGVLLGAWTLGGGALNRVGLAPGWAGAEWIAVALGLLAAALMAWQALALRSREDQLANVREQLGSIALLAPRNAREMRRFDVLSFTAGICEEIVFRGILLGLLADLLGVWPAFVATTLLFGVAHAYQGASGVLRTGLFGAVAGLLTIFSGSVYVATVLHVVVDLTQGRMLAAAVATDDASACGDAATPAHAAVSTTLRRT